MLLTTFSFKDKATAPTVVGLPKLNN